MDFTLDDKFFQDLGVDFGLMPDAADPFANISEMNFGDFLDQDVLRDFEPSAMAPMLPEQPTCFDEFEGLSTTLSPQSNPSSLRSMSSKLSDAASSPPPQAPPSRMVRATVAAARSSAAAAAAALASSASSPKLHPTTYASSPHAMAGGMRGCPKRHRKTIQIKRQEQQGRLDVLNTRHSKLQEAVRLAASEVTAARQTLYHVLKTARQGQLEAFSPAP